MAREIERKFLVAGDDWRNLARSSTRMEQGYLTLDPERIVRVRLAGDQGFLTIKGATEGISRVEFEYEIPADEAEDLLQLCVSTVISKVRYLIPWEGYTWEVDEFHDDHEGLIVAEVELTSESEQPPLPDWIGVEVSNDERYYNAWLSQHPWREWKDSDS